MKRFSWLYLVFFFCLINISIYSQPGEYGYDCTAFKEIIVPFNSSTVNNNLNNKHSLNQTVFYSFRDQYTFWYKIIAKEEALLSFKIDPINDSDTYVVYVYQYNEKDFCNKVYTKKIVPVKPTFFKNKVTIESLSDLSEKSFAAKKDQTYYISVLNTSLNNCGHSLKLSCSTDTLKVKAIHIPCKRDFSTLAIKPLTKLDAKKKQDTISAKVSLSSVPKNKSVVTDTLNDKNSSLFCIIKDSKKNTLLKIKPVITEVLSGEELQVTASESGDWVSKVEIGKSYKIKCSSLGYKTSTQTILINEKATHLDLLIEPLKEGDAFVMKSIYFYPNTYALKKESAAELQRLLNFLNENENVIIQIQGHTNGDHKVAKNKAYATLGEEWNFQGSAKELSLKRAETIKSYLEGNGILQNRLVPVGYGGKKPIIKDPQDNEEGQMNIRVEIVILKS